MQKTEDTSRLCSSCNEFYANSTTNYLCSTCFKKNTNNKIQQKNPQPTVESKEKPQVAPKQQSKPQQADASRCFKCRKNVGLLGISCKCGFIYCNKHRMPEEHECGVDYKKIGKEELAKRVESVAPRKLSEI